MFQKPNSPAKKNPYNLETSPTALSPEHADPYHLIAPNLIAPNLVALREAGFLKRLPYIPAAELDDKNKSDSLVRFIAVIQILSIIIQIIIRGIRHLAVSQLEIAVFAFSVCAIVIYCLNWEKPKSVQVPYTLLQYRGDIPKLVLECVAVRSSRKSLVHSMLDFFRYLIMLGGLLGPTDDIPGSRIQNHFTINKVGAENDYWQVTGLFIGGTMFGAVHVAAWDFVFPTSVERNRWQATSIICVSVPVLFLLLFQLGGWIGRYITNRKLESIGFGLTVGFFLVLVPLYIMSRLFLLVEIFRTLLFLPPSAYVSTWATNVPHIA